MGFMKVGNKQVWVDADFKEAEHPRAKNGQFGEKGSGEGAKAKESSAPSDGGTKHILYSSSLNTLVKENAGKHKTVASFCQALLSHENALAWSNQDIAYAAQNEFGGKTSAASIAWYKMQAKKQTPEGKAAAKAKAEGMAKNDVKIDEAEKKPMPPKELDKKLAEAEKPGYKTMFVKATDKFGKTTFLKLGGIPDGLDNYDSIYEILGKQGYKVHIANPWDANKPVPPNVHPFNIPESVLDKAKQDAYAEAAIKAAKNKIMTELEEKLDQHMEQAVKHYTNGSYSDLNRKLRSGQPMSPGQCQLAFKLDAAINRSKATEDFHVYRGCASPIKFFGPNPTIGTVAIDNGYISTSKNTSVAVGFGGSNGGLVAKIKISKGCKAMDVSKLSLHPSEKEVVLPRGAMFTVTAVKGHIVECDYVCG